MPKPNPKQRGALPDNGLDSQERGWFNELLIGASGNALGTWIALFIPTLLGILSAIFLRIGLPAILLGVAITVWLACAYIAFVSKQKALSILNRIQQRFHWKQTAFFSFFALPLIVAPSTGYYWCSQNRATTPASSLSCIVDTTNPNLRFILPIVFALIIVPVIYAIFKRTARSRGRAKYTWQYPRLRFWGISSLYICAVLILGVSATFVCNPTRKIKVLVANFEDPDEQKARVTDSVLSQLRTAFSRYDDVLIQPLGQKITEQEGSLVAQSEGNAEKADFVIWGWYGERAEDGTTPLSLNLEILCQIKCRPKLNKELQGAVRELKESDLKKASLRTRVTNEVTYATLFIVGSVRMEANDYDGAVDNFENAIRQTDESIPGIEQRTIYSYLGTAYWAAHKYDKSLETFQKMVKLVPNDEEGYRGMADAYFGMEQLDNAIIYYTQAISITPIAGDYSNLGEIYLAKEDYDTALTNYQKEVALSPDSATSYFDRGHGYYFKRDYKNAIRDYNKALELDAGTYKAYERLGDVYLDTREFDRAIENYTTAIECQSFAESDHAYYGRGLVYNAQGKYDYAISEFTKAISIRNDVHDYYRSRAFAYTKKGQENLALPDLNKAIQLDDYDDEAYIIRAQIFEKVGQRDNAIRDYEKVLEITNDNNIRNFANQHLTTLKSH
ncbi:MAG: tetratricopeptide repeat protein [Kouleothrix sp.]|jgi:tetratricopeptide (TPR) repeat protein|nr:tetratricopeptide repeat protein [Kouleothrix sp.]